MILPPCPCSGRLDAIRDGSGRYRCTKCRRLFRTSVTLIPADEPGGALHFREGVSDGDPYPAECVTGYTERGSARLDVPKLLRWFCPSLTQAEADLLARRMDALPRQGVAGTKAQILAHIDDVRATLAKEAR